MISVTQSQLFLAGHPCAHQPMASYLDLQEKKSSISVLKIMDSKNPCALEFACILGRNIKYSVIFIIIINHSRTFFSNVKKS